MIKKLFIAAALSAAMCVSAAPRLPRVAVPTNLKTVKTQIPAPQGVTSHAASRADNTVTFSYCGAPASAYSIGSFYNGYRVLQLTEIPASVTKAFAGSAISAINIAAPTTNSGLNPITEPITIAIYTDLSSKPVYTQTAKLGSVGVDYNKIALETPFVITGDTPVYFGYEFSYKTAYASAGYVIADNGEDFAGYSYIGVAAGATASMEILNCASIGLYQNLCITADVEVSEQTTDYAVMDGIYSNPAVVAGEPFALELDVTNMSTSAALNSIEVAYTVNGVEGTYSHTFDTPLPFLRTETVVFEAQTETTGLGIEVTAKIAQVNGKPNAVNPDDVVSLIVDVLGEGMGVQRNVVVEEATGTWCQYCPRGYLLMEDIRDYENYIGIAVHDGDAMATSTYSGFISKYIEGYPQYYMNRMVSPGLTDDHSVNLYYFDAYYNIIASWPAIAAIDFDPVVDAAQGTVEVNASTTFGAPGAGNYRLAVVVKEDSVGPYRQTNAFYGTEGWGVFSTTARPSLKYNDVARGITTWNGIAGSLPETIEAGVPYEFSTSVSTATVSGNECDIAVMLINGNDGTIEQAVSKHVVIRDVEESINEINVDSSAAADYFDLNGRRLSAPGRGLTIVRTANGVCKILR